MSKHSMEEPAKVPPFFLSELLYRLLTTLCLRYITPLLHTTHISKAFASLDDHVMRRIHWDKRG